MELKKWLLPTVFITSRRLRTIIPMALWILSGVPSDTLLHDYSSLPSSRLLQLCILFFFPPPRKSRATTHNYTQPLRSESDEPEKPFDSPKARAPPKTIPVTKSTMPSFRLLLSARSTALSSPKRGSHYAPRPHSGLMDSGGEQEQHVCLNKSKAGRRFTSLSSFH